MEDKDVKLEQVANICPENQVTGFLYGKGIEGNLYGKCPYAAERGSRDIGTALKIVTYGVLGGPIWDAIHFVREGKPNMFMAMFPKKIQGGKTQSCRVNCKYLNGKWNQVS